MEKYQAESKTQKNVVPFKSDGCLGLFIAQHELRGGSLSRTASLQLPLIGLILTPLERF